MRWSLSQADLAGHQLLAWNICRETVFRMGRVVDHLQFPIRTSEAISTMHCPVGISFFISELTVVPERNGSDRSFELSELQKYQVDLGVDMKTCCLRADPKIYHTRLLSFNVEESCI